MVIFSSFVWLPTAIISGGIMLFTMTDLSVGVCWASLVMMSLATVPYLIFVKSPMGMMKYLLYQESYSVLLSVVWCVSVNMSSVICVLLFLKMGIAPFGAWLEAILEEMTESLHFVFTLPKLIPTWLSGIFFTDWWNNMFFMVFGLFSAMKIMSESSTLVVFLYMGNFSVLFAILMSTQNTHLSFFWFVIYSLCSYFILYSMEMKCLGFFEFFWISALPPSPFFLLKIVILYSCSMSVLNVLVLLFIFLIPVLFFVWFYTTSIFVYPTRSRNLSHNFFYTLMIISFWSFFVYF